MKEDIPVAKLIADYAKVLWTFGLNSQESREYKSQVSDNGEFQEMARVVERAHSQMSQDGEGS